MRFTNDDEFDKQFHKTVRAAVRATSTGLAGFALLWWLVSMLVSLAVLCGLGYVAYHFISKFW